MQSSERESIFLTDVRPGREYEFIEAYIFDGQDSDEADDMITLVARADRVEQTHANNPAILAALMQFRLDYFINLDDKVPGLYRAIARSPETSAIRLMLVRRLMSLKRYAEAEVVLKPLLDGQCIDALDTAYDLALTHHLAGRNRDGLRLLDACRQISPEIMQNPSFAKVHRVARELRNLTVPFDAAKRLRLDRALIHICWTMLVVAVLGVLMLFGLGIGSVYLGYHAEVYVVNGLDRAYTVTLNGTPYSMTAHGVRKVDSPEDDIRVAVSELPAIGPAIAPVHQPFFTRLHQPAIFVINPDGGAILEETAPLDSEYGFADREKHRRYIAGKTLLQFGPIDLPFEGLPFKHSIEHQLSLQTRLSLLQQHTSFSVERDLPKVARELPQSELLNILQVQSHFSAHSDAWQNALSSEMRR